MINLTLILYANVFSTISIVMKLIFSKLRKIMRNSRVNQLSISNVSIAKTIVIEKKLIKIEKRKIENKKKQKNKKMRIKKTKRK